MFRNILGLGCLESRQVWTYVVQQVRVRQTGGPRDYYVFFLYFFYLCLGLKREGPKFAAGGNFLSSPAGSRSRIFIFIFSFEPTTTRLRVSVYEISVAVQQQLETGVVSLAFLCCVRLSALMEP
jgi:hypothetical protein